VVIAVTGALEALGEVPGRAGLLRTDYGRTLLVKLGLAAGVLLLAAIVRLRLLPRVHDGHPRRRLRRLVSVEAAGALAVVLVAAVLANTVPGRWQVTVASPAADLQLQALVGIAAAPATVGRRRLTHRTRWCWAVGPAARRWG
jgi:copper transport protein